MKGRILPNFFGTMHLVVGPPRFHTQKWSHTIYDSAGRMGLGGMRRKVFKLGFNLRVSEGPFGVSCTGIGLVARNTWAWDLANGEPVSHKLSPWPGPMWFGPTSNLRDPSLKPFVIRGRCLMLRFGCPAHKGMGHSMHSLKGVERTTLNIVCREGPLTIWNYTMLYNFCQQR